MWKLSPQSRVQSYTNSRAYFCPGTCWTARSLWASQLLAGALSPNRGLGSLRAQLPQGLQLHFFPAGPQQRLGVGGDNHPVESLAPSQALGCPYSLRASQPLLNLRFTPSPQHSGWRSPLDHTLPWVSSGAQNTSKSDLWAFLTNFWKLSSLVLWMLGSPLFPPDSKGSFGVLPSSLVEDLKVSSCGASLHDTTFIYSFNTYPGASHMCQVLVQVLGIKQ